MPIYEYQCDACKHHFDKLQKINDPLPECPSCKQTTVRKLVSAVSFQLKGSGWYKSDYKNVSNKTEDKKSEGSVNQTDSKKVESGADKKESKKEEGGSSDSGSGSKNMTESKTETVNKSKVKDAA